MRDKASAMVRSGIDPIDDRERQRAGTSASRPSFDECAKKFIEAHEPSWRNAKHRQQWDHTLRDYASPVLGAMLVEVITTEHVLEALKPLWIKKPETASRVRQRIERVMDFAKVHGYRQGENPARWRGHLDNLLPAPTRIAKVKHFAAMSYDVGAFTQTRHENRNVHFVSRFALTAARSGETLGALWSEIDLA
jgi:integrase